MAAVVGVNTTKVDAGTKQDNWIEQGRIKSGMKLMSETYEAAALAMASTIKVANMPSGAVIHGAVLYWDALGAGVTISLGDSNDALRYSTALVTTAAGAAIADKVDGAAYEIGTNTGDTAILITTGVGAATGTIKVVIFYTN